MADVEEVVAEAIMLSRPEIMRPSRSLRISTRSSSQSSAQVIPITTSPPSEEDAIHYLMTSPAANSGAGGGGGGELNLQDAWLPITESRNGNTYSATFHLVCSGIGIQALLLPLAFATLGWAWGIICFSIAFSWQLYTTWLLVHLHESGSGIRYSRYLHLTIMAFGTKLGKLVAIFPVMYLSGGTCAQLIIIGGGILNLFLKNVCEVKSLSGAESFLVFMLMAIVVAQFPNLNSIAWVSFIGTITAIVYFTLIWTLSVGKGRPSDISYDPPQTKSDMDRFGGIMNSIGIIFLAFKGHNVMLEIQGTLPSNPKQPSHTRMWRGVTISYAIIAMCLLPLAIAGFWAYGNKMPPSYGGILNSISQFHGHNTSKFVLGLICILVVTHCLSSFQIYSMVVFDNLEFKYTSRNNKACARWLRIAFRVFFGGVAFFVALAFPFLPSLAPLIGGLTLPLVYAYPCFMWVRMRKPEPQSGEWCVNMGLGCLGLALTFVLVIAAVWNLADKGLNANFFNP